MAEEGEEDLESGGVIVFESLYKNSNYKKKKKKKKKRRRDKEL